MIFGLYFNEKLALNASIVTTTRQQKINHKYYDNRETDSELYIRDGILPIYIMFHS